MGKYDELHTCHNECERPACVLRRKVAALEAELAAMKARGDRLVNYAAHAENCGAADIGRCTCGMAQALTEWRDQ